MKKKIATFQDLEVWQHGHSFVIDAYKTTQSFPKHEMYGLVSQLRRAAASITSNIAEGFSRYSYKDKNRFYFQSRGSVSECQNLIFICRDVEYLAPDKADQLLAKINKVNQILNGLIRSTGERSL